MARSKGVRTNGNVFESLGFSSADAENLRVRACIMNALIGHIEQRKLTQLQAAKMLGITQPRVSDLLRGKIELFSIDKLVNLLAAAGLRMDLRVRKAA